MRPERVERSGRVPTRGRPLPDFDLTVEASFQKISDMLVRLRVALHGSSPRAAADDALELVLAEACNNVAEHALAGREGEAFRLALWVERDRVLVRLTDRGRPMPDGRPPHSDACAQPAETLPEGGFGWGLIRRLCTSVRYARSGGENRLDLDIPIRAHACK